MQHQHAYPPITSEDGDIVTGYIMQEGDRSDEMFIVLEGAVRIERNGDSGATVCIPNSTYIDYSPWLVH